MSWLANANANSKPSPNLNLALAALDLSLQKFSTPLPAPYPVSPCPALASQFAYKKSQVAWANASHTGRMRNAQRTSNSNEAAVGTGEEVVQEGRKGEEAEAAGV